MKKTVSLILILLTLGLVCLCACGPSYRTDAEPSALMEKALRTMQGDPGDFTEPEEDFIDRNIGDLEGLVGSSLRLHRQSGNFSEVGIFRLSDAKSASEAEQKVRAYIQRQQEYLGDFLSQYEATEVEKINNAQVKVYGVYVVYGFLTKADANAFFGEIGEQLKA